MISPTLLYRGTVAASATTVATTVGNGTTTINSIVATNKTASARVFSITVGGIYLAYLMPLAPNQTVTLDVRQVCLPSTVVQAWADSASAVDIGISAAVQTGVPYIGSGTGSPEGVVTANVASEWMQTDDATFGNMKWVKLSGTGNTGWYPDFDGRWKTYTPTMIGAGGNPTITTKDGRYTQYGKTIFYKFRFVTWTGAGSGIYYVPLPVNANTTQPWASGNVYLYDNSSSNGYNGFVYVDWSGTKLGMVYPVPAGTSSYVAAAAPWGWTTSDEINGQVTYEAA